MTNLMAIDKLSDIPVYKQISIQLIKSIKDGELSKNQQLPPERELAYHLGVSRGTIKKAYEKLIQSGYATAEQGSGTYVSYADIDTNISLQKDKAKSEVDNLISNLLNMGFDFKEMESLIKVRLLNKKNSMKKINIAAVDCNLEALNIIKHQLSYIENINFMGFLLKDVLDYTHPEEIFDEFDVIFTTTTHFNDLKDFISKFSNKIVKAVMSTDRETIVKTSSIIDTDKTGVITKTPRFAEIIKNNLSALNITLEKENYITTLSLSENKLKSFISDKKTLILPPLFAMDLAKAMGEEILNFNHVGGEIITFNYIIERGSLIYIEEKITNVLNKKF